jgi:hypothetical protein
VACRESFLSRFAPRAYRRPLTGSETDRLRTVFDVGRADGGFAAGLQLAVEAVLQSPQFLYREELGPPTATPGTATVRLTDHELASELSFLLLGSMPDAALFDAAAKGKLRTADGLSEQLERLLAAPAARTMVSEFLQQWLGTTQLDSVTKRESAYPIFTTEVAVAMKEELGLFLEDGVWQRNGLLLDLLSSTAGWVDVPLARLYGVPAPPASGLHPVALDATVRQGVLTRVGFLSVHSAPDESAPIARGVFVLRSLLCRALPAPPADLPGAGQPLPLPGDYETRTTRERYAQHSSAPVCAACHRMIDGIGFGLEQFDAVGALRSTERDKPIDTSGELVGTDVDGPFTGGSELSERLGRSVQVHACFAQSLARFVMGQAALTADDPAIEPTLRRFGAGLKVLELLRMVVQSSAFASRATER